MSKILIAGGLGFVGKAVRKLFPEADVLDERAFDGEKLGVRFFVTPPKKRYDFCHICLPTPMKDDGSCDTSAVEEVIGKINADLFIIRSTIPPGTTERLANHYCLTKEFVFQPEFCSSKSPYPSPLGDLRSHPFIILGGEKESVKKARRLYEAVYQPIVRIYEVTALEAEVAKLFENTAIANKVTLCQEFYEICKIFNVDYDHVKECVFIADPRFNPWFTNVYPEKRGFSSSHCLPKDLSNLIYSCRLKGYEPKFIQDIINNNNRWINDYEKQ